MTDIIIPIKNLKAAKTRLSDVLEPAFRRELVLAMLQDLLAVIREVSCGQVWVVASDEKVFGLAREFGARQIREDHSHGYNSAVTLGLSHIPDNTNVAILPGDVPLAGKQEILALTTPACQATPTIRIAPAYDRKGTNGLFLSRKSLIRPGFGVESFARHQAAAKAAGIVPDILHSPWLAHDIDTSGDLDFFTSQCSHGATCKLVRSMGDSVFNKFSKRGVA